MKAFIVALSIVLMVMAADPKSCDKPAGSAGGDSAGNNQPNYKAEQCALPGKMKINPIALVKVDGLHYSAAAYLMEGDCSPIDSDGPGNSMKITLAAIDSVGRRVDPVLDSSPEESPWTGLVKLAVPTSFDIHLVATGNITRTQAKDLGAVFIGCMLAPVDTDKQPTSLQVADIGAGKGKVECRVRK